MEMQNARVLAVTREQAWQALNDPDVLKICIPGCEQIEPTGEDAYALVCAIKVGPVAAKFKGNITMTDVLAPEHYDLNFDGNGGAAGFGKGTAKVTLAPHEQGCELSYQVTATVGGKIAQVGQRLIDGVAKSMAENFFKRFDEEMQRRYPDPETVAVAPDGGGNAELSTRPTDTLPDTATPDRAGARKIPSWLWLILLLVLVWVLWASGAV